MTRADEIKNQGSADRNVEESAQWQEFLLFRVASHHFAIETSHLQRAFYLDNLTPIPLTHPAILGLTGLGGIGVPLIHIPTLLGSDEAVTPLRGSRCILVDVDGYQLALSAEEIIRIITIPRSEKVFLDGELSNYTFSYDDRMSMELDPDKLIHRIRTVLRRYQQQIGVASVK